ncbi:cell division protein FtsA [bacterium (Candidatus Gribaldobacteria) CG10_big_fil_rev_8_21_14_0_10_37_21]|uniref:Cell division protein FtsA n=1 Tax=bacterium (Candidatus Gribaldobacteria) CG10_big_fil_rev_8_21_14_0_10_37_21 TaxID=2014275 RepID=A0A2H0UVA6_9BACT|nr:MAG: cell division protein FtsA [Parcubacteria group bacterium CG1_02_37_13]PIR90747.1 MAG: cell division protein FtsA [bacterium (Candidatus Gribaldobacteria) CG10_big_fil_rev_8_21_14_0_10_37_21]
MKNQIFTSLDIGSHSIKGVCLKQNNEGIFEALAHSHRPCFVGVRAGEVIKPEEVAKAIQRVKSELGKKVNLKIKKVFVNISGAHISSVPSQGLVSVSRADQKISKEDVKRVLKAAEAINLPSNREILEVFPKEFIIDGEGGLKDPAGLEGIRLEVKVILSTIFSPVLANLYQAVEGAGLEIEDIILSPLAQARAILNEEQKELGVALVDLGFATTSLAIFEKGDLIDFAIFPVGSSHITNDLAILLRTEIETAENIKKQYAKLAILGKKAPTWGQKKEKSAKEDLIEIPEKAIKFSRKFLLNIVESRVDEIFSEVEKHLKKMTGQEQLPAGLVLTGGGASLPGIVEFAKEKFNLPCRVAQIYGIKGADGQEFSACYGMAMYALEKEGSFEHQKSGGTSFFAKIKKFFKIVFKAFLP